MQYSFITDLGETKGPYELEEITSRVRNGVITPATKIIVDGGEPTPAIDIPSLRPLFELPKTDFGSYSDSTATPQVEIGAGTLPLDIMALLREGWGVIVNQPTAAMACAVVVFAGGLFCLITKVLFPAVMVALLVPFFGAATWFLSLLVMRRFVLGQRTDANYIEATKRKTKSLAILTALAGCITMSLPLMVAVFASNLVGLLLLMVGFFAFTFLSFAPFYVEDGIEPGQALLYSRDAMMRLGLANAGVLFGVFMVNLICSFLFLVPLFLTMPMTAAAFSLTYLRFGGIPQAAPTA